MAKWDHLMNVIEQLRCTVIVGSGQVEALGICWCFEIYCQTWDLWLPILLLLVVTVLDLLLLASRPFLGDGWLIWSESRLPYFTDLWRNHAQLKCKDDWQKLNQSTSVIFGERWAQVKCHRAVNASQLVWMDWPLSNNSWKKPTFTFQRVKVTLKWSCFPLEEKNILLPSLLALSSSSMSSSLSMSLKNRNGRIFFVPVDSFFFLRDPKKWKIQKLEKKFGSQ